MVESNNHNKAISKQKYQRFDEIIHTSFSYVSFICYIKEERKKKNQLVCIN